MPLDFLKNLKHFAGCLMLMTAIYSDMFFNQAVSDLFSYQFLIELICLIMGTYMMSGYYSNRKQKDHENKKL